MLIRHREQLDAEIAELDVALSTYGDEPAKNGAVIRFRKRFSPSGQTFRYAGIRAGGLWYLTGSRAPQRQTWDQLIAWLSGGAPAVAFEVVHPGGKHQTTERIDIIPLDPKATGC
jgi:hypothetical protein